MTGETIIKNSLIFVIGVATGSAVTYSLLKTKYDKIANDEISEMREYYISKMESTKEKDSEADTVTKAEQVKVEDKPNLVDYTTKIKENGYNGDDAKKEEDEEDEEDEVVKPYVISPEELGEEYDIIELTYYANGILTDDTDDPIDSADIDGMVGLDSLNCFGKYEEDAVHVRNDERKLDYEILRVLDEYEEV